MKLLICPVYSRGDYHPMNYHYPAHAYYGSPEQMPGYRERHPHLPPTDYYPPPAAEYDSRRREYDRRAPT